MKANRGKAEVTMSNEDADVLDTLLEKLRNGDNVGRKARRARPSADARPAIPPSLNLEAAPADATVDIARDMLARLKSDGFQTAMPISPNPSIPPRRRRRREKPTLDFDTEIPLSPSASSDVGSERGFDPGVEEDTPMTP